ncbi:MAG: hypothetical protein LBQ52_00885 [Helicobacteraceae bacterium]|jgi:hypothetical protein|nr:hypothetical protein [Helicobacteraceae bacterium]
MRAFTRNYLAPIAIYAIFSAIGLALISLFLHINLFDGVVLYYSRLLLYVVAVCLISVFVSAFFMKELSVAFRNAIVAAIVIQVCVCAAFVTIAPTNIDRSFSVFFLSEMYENEGKEYSTQELESLFVDRYVLIGGVTRRINEQISLGNIVQTGGGGSNGGSYFLTPKGKRLVETMRLIEKIYPVDSKVQLYPKEIER